MTEPRNKNRKTSRFHGVAFTGASYAVKFTLNGERFYVASFQREEDAAVARDRVVLHLGLDVPLNFPKRARALGPASVRELRHESRAAAKVGASSEYFGVVWNPDRQKYDVRISVPGRRPIWVAQFTNDEKAAIAYDRVALHLLGRSALRNFPDVRLKPATIEEMRDWPSELSGRPRRGQGAARAADAQSRTHGVAFVEASNRYQASVTVGGKLVSAGRYLHAKDAAVARDRAALYLGLDVPMNYPILAKRLGAASPEALREWAKGGTTSTYRGVIWEPRRQKYSVEVNLGGRKKVWVAHFTSEEHAAIAHDRFVLHFFGKDAPRNFPGRRLRPASISELRDWASSLSGYSRARNGSALERRRSSAAGRTR